MYRTQQMIEEMVSWFAAMLAMAMMAGMMRTMMKAALAPRKKRPELYGPRGERLLPQTSSVIIGNCGLRGYDGGRPHYVRGGMCETHGYSVSKGNSCPKSTLTPEEWWEAWERAKAQMAVDELLPQTELRRCPRCGQVLYRRKIAGQYEYVHLRWPGTKAEAITRCPGETKAPPKTERRSPARDDVRVEVWEERDRLHIGIQDKETGEYIASWWDDEAREMFEQGFFKRGRGLEESVLDYAEEVGLLAPARPLQTRSKVHFVGSCKVSEGRCLTHGHPASETAKCPQSPLTAEEWEAAFELVKMAFPEGQHNPWVNGWWPETLEEAEKAVRGYERSLWDAFRKYEARTREAVELYRRSTDKAAYNYRYYVMREYEKGKERVGVPVLAAPRLVGPTERREPPEELKYFADSSDHIEQSMDHNGLRAKVDRAFQEAIARARQGRAG